MLIEFRVKNYRSFHTEQTLSMVADEAEAELLESNSFSLSENPPLRLLKNVAIYGANASGKSNLLKSLFIFRQIVVQSATQMTVGTPLNVQPFKFNSQSQNEPTEFEVIFIVNQIRYQYLVVLDASKIYHEELVSYPHDKPQNLFIRSYSEKQIDDTYIFGKNLKGEKLRLTKFVRPNSLFLSHAAQNNHPQLTEIYQWFDDKLNFIQSISGLTISQCIRDENFRKRVVSLLLLADIDILDIKVETKKIFIPDEVKALLSEILLTGENTQKHILLKQTIEEKVEAVEVTTFHKMNDSDILASLNLDDESDGTQRLFELAGIFLYVLEHGEILVIDELDKSLHPLLAKGLVKMFNDANLNKNQAQLIFATHDTTLLDDDILRPDQIWFTEKQRGMTKLFSLLEYKKLPENETLQRGYLLGRYGGVPSVNINDLR